MGSCFRISTWSRSIFFRSLVQITLKCFFLIFITYFYVDCGLDGLWWRVVLKMVSVFKVEDGGDSLPEIGNSLRTTQWQNPDYRNLHFHRRENFISHWIYLLSWEVKLFLIVFSNPVILKLNLKNLKKSCWPIMRVCVRSFLAEN